MFSFKHCLLILLIAAIDLVKADDGAFVAQWTIRGIISLVVVVLIGIAIYKCVKRNEEYYNDGDYTTCECFSESFSKIAGLEFGLQMWLDWSQTLTNSNSFRFSSNSGGASHNDDRLR